MRVIARLDIKGPNVVKTVQTEGLRVVGEPAELAERYYVQGADELIYLDIVASLYRRNLDFEQLKRASAEVFVPLTVGGGIRSLHDIALALGAGADKVAINTYAVHNPTFLKEAAEMFGSQCIVLSVEAKKIGDNAWEVYTDGGRETTGKDVVEWVGQALQMGVGEILLTSVDKDGTKEGYDLGLLRAVSAISPVPVIIHGGAGSADDVVRAAKKGADAVSVSSILHYDLATIPDIKNALAAEHISVRI